jgi:hypothetical protein
VNCFVHTNTAAVGLCAACQKAVCRACVGRESPRLICAACAGRGAVIGFEHRSEFAIGNLPFLHVCLGVDAATGRPKVARGVIAVGNVAVGIVALGGVAFGLLSLGGVAVGLLLALGGAALGVGVSFGGLAVGSVAIGGAAVGFVYALGGGAVGPAIIDGRHCNEAARQFFVEWFGRGFLPPSCR